MRSVIRFQPLVLVAALTCFAAPPAAAQSSARPSNSGGPDTGSITRGWTLLASGDRTEAARLAADLLARFPRSAAVLGLAIEIEIARGGAASGLDAYERWLGTRTVEEAYTVRRVAGALLREIAAGDADRANRLAAIEALLADGEADASTLLPPAGSSAPAEIAVRASTGNAAAFDALMAMAAQPGPARRAVMLPLGRTRNPRAAAVLTAALSDPDPTVRTASAEGLGALQAGSAVSRLKPLLDDPVVTVRLAAAGSLMSLNDQSGMPLLRQLLASEHAAIRVAAARAASSAADAEWLTVVRELTKDQDADVRRQAAELIAPHDPDLARTTLEPLLTDPNPAVRQAAADSYASSTTNVTILRRYLRDADSGTRIRAADRMLQLTR